MENREKEHGKRGERRQTYIERQVRESGTQIKREEKERDRYKQRENALYIPLIRIIW